MARVYSFSAVQVCEMLLEAGFSKRTKDAVGDKPCDVIGSGSREARTRLASLLGIRRPVPSSETVVPELPVQKCEECEREVGSLSCAECEMVFCESCR